MKHTKPKITGRKIIPFLLLFVFIFACYPLSAQEERDSESEDGGEIKMDFGAKFGTTISQFTDQQPYTNNATGITAGAFARYGFNERFALQLEVNYSQQGGRITDFKYPSLYGLEDQWYNMKVENQYVRLHQLEIPLLGEFAVNLEDTRVKVNLGPAVSYNIHSGMYSEGTAFTDREFHTYTGEENVTSNINSYEYSAIGGIGFEFNVSGGIFLTVDARYKYAFNPVYEGYSYIGIPQIQGDLKNNALIITLGCGFNKSKLFN